MKNLEIINSSIKKFGKGIIAIFAIKLLLFGGVFIIQSCENDNNHNLFIDSKKEIALKDFNNLIEPTISRVNIVLKKLELKKKSKKARLKINNKTETNDRSFQSIEGLKYQVKLDIQMILNPLVSSSKKFLKTYGITENDLSKEFDNLNDSRIALIGLVMLELEKEINSKITFNFNNIIATKTYAQDASKVWNCGMRSLGVSTFMEGFGAIRKGNKVILKKIGLKVLKKVASRFLGPIGVAIAAVDFVMCMNEGYLVTPEIVQITSCDDLVYIYLKNKKKYVFLLKKDINYISMNNFEIKPTGYYNTYELSDATKLDFENPVCENVVKNFGTSKGIHFDTSRISDFFILED